MQKKYLRFLNTLVLCFYAVLPLNAQNLDGFRSGLDSVRTYLKIPGMVVGLAHGDRMIDEEGFGYADIKAGIKVTPATCFRVASITKTFTSTLVMQLVQEGKLNLDDPISKFGIDLGNPRITVRNLLTHASEEEPGSHYQYNGFRFGKLGLIIEKTTGSPFYEVLVKKIIEPLNMEYSAPGIFGFSDSTDISRQQDLLPFFERSFSRLAKPYEINGNGQIVESQYYNEFGAFGGLITNVSDLVKYSRAIDRQFFLNKQIQHLVFTQNKLKNGKPSPYGLGWFVQRYHDVDFYWHYGQTRGESGLFIKVPSRDLTLVVLTNIINLSSPFQLGDGDLFASPVGELFYKFVINNSTGLAHVNYNEPAGKILKSMRTDSLRVYKDFYNNELVANATMDLFRGDTAQAMELYRVYGRLNNFKNLEVNEGSVIAKLVNVGINEQDSISFTLAHPTTLKIDGVGEDCSGDFSSWCDYGWIEDRQGKVIWQMQGMPALPAGGAAKNQRVNALITLPAGIYKLKYKSDGGHSFNNWDSAPPRDFFWGIIVKIAK